MFVACQMLLTGNKRGRNRDWHFCFASDMFCILINHVTNTHSAVNKKQ